MFSNIGRKIKILAKTLFWLLVIISILGAIGMIIVGFSMKEGKYILQYCLFAILIVVGGILSAWLSNFMLYGFGELIDTNQRIANYLEQKENK